jgi:hypothetical protein
MEPVGQFDLRRRIEGKIDLSRARTDSLIELDTPDER